MQALPLKIIIVFIILLQSGCTGKQINFGDFNRKDIDQTQIVNIQNKGSKMDNSVDLDNVYPDPENNIEYGMSVAAEKELIDTVSLQKGEINTIPTPTTQITLQSEADIIIRTKIEATDPSSVILADGSLKFIEFFAFWCPVCKSMAPIIHKLDLQYLQTIKFIYLDIDDPNTNKLKNELRYMYQPHFFLLDGQGDILNQWIGYVSEETLISVLDDLR